MALLETRIDTGALRGIRGESPDVTVFRGIPFAAPPVGDNRWKAPLPAAPWEGVRDCSSFGRVCPQTDFDPDAFYVHEFYHALARAPMSEDCLYLNVWTPASAASDRLPVLFWIHGGGFVHGAGSEFPFDGEAMARRGVILVTSNYRLGVLGFLAHPELSAESPTGSSGNYGLLDQAAALDWTRRNIAAFGGDPGRITVFGQSAGAMSVQMLLTSPLTMDKMAGAILQSGGGLHTFGRITQRQAGEKLGPRWMKACGWDSGRSRRDKSPEELFAALDEANSRVEGRPFGFRPVVDGYLVTEEPLRTIRDGRLPDIPILAGSLADEGNSLGGSRDITIGMAAGSRALASIWPRRTGRPAWHYHFTRKAPGDDRGAFHSAELWYVFGTQSRAWRPWEPVDAVLSERMSGYWTGFAKNGDPNGPGLPAWPSFSEDAPLSLRIGEETVPFRLDADPEIAAAERKLFRSLAAL